MGTWARKRDKIDEGKKRRLRRKWMRCGRKEECGGYE